MEKLLFLLAIVRVAATIDSERSMWEEHKEKFSLDFSSEEEEKRFQFFINNIRHIEKLNQLNLGYTTKINKFASWSPEEFKQRLLPYTIPVIKKRIPTPPRRFLNIRSHPNKQEVNWVSKGVVTPVKNQGHCGSCWAFSTTGAVEGAYALKNGHLKSFSEQQLVDCSLNNNGCDGGLPSQAMEYIMANGLTSEEDYSYSAHEGICKLGNKSNRVFISDYVNLPQSDYDLDQALQTVGPISVAIDASTSGFQFYKSGIFQSPECMSNGLNHAVLLVGYGYDEDAEQEYYLLKNSWGIEWGMDGYFKLPRHGKNDCGVSLMATYPII